MVDVVGVEGRKVVEAAERLAEAFFSAHLEAYRRGLVLEAVALAAEQLAGGLLACDTGGATDASVPSGAPPSVPGIPTIGGSSCPSGSGEMTPAKVGPARSLMARVSPHGLCMFMSRCSAASYRWPSCKR